jgi:hypothetical protein
MDNANSQDLTALKSNRLNFKPVHWKISVVEGGFSLENDTDRNEIIQVTHKKGGFYIYKFDGQEISCRASFSDDAHQLSSICILKPDETLKFDLDMMTLKSAEGTYQIAFEN